MKSSNVQLGDSTVANDPRPRGKTRNKILLLIPPPVFPTGCCAAVLSMPTSQPKEPVHLGCFVRARVLSWAPHVLQRHSPYKVLGNVSGGRDDAVVYLLVQRVGTGEHATALVGWYPQLARDVQLVASDGRKHSAVQVYACKRSKQSSNWRRRPWLILVDKSVYDAWTISPNGAFIRATKCRVEESVLAWLIRLVKYAMTLKLHIGR